MTFEVLVDGKAAGTLKEIKAEEREVATQSSTADPRQGVVKEEVVVQVSGPLTLPAGEHEILFIHRNIVDGKLETVAVGP